MKYSEDGSFGNTEQFKIRKKQGFIGSVHEEYGESNIPHAV